MKLYGSDVSAVPGPPRARRGFTLIEVLVVVAIIALLISILLPSLARVRSQAKSLACKASLHDLGQAFTMYADQFKAYYPVIHHPFAFDSFQGLYDARLLRNPQILVCPATRNVVRPGTIRRARTAADYQPSIVPDDIGVRMPFIADSDISKTAKTAVDNAGGHSYEYISTYDNTPTPARPSPLVGRRKRPTQFVFPPAEMLLVHDADDAPAGNGALGCSGSVGVVQGNGSNAGNNCPQPWDNHGSEGMNMMFADGHAQFTRKAGGLYRDYTVTPVVSRANENASIDRVWLKSNAPGCSPGDEGGLGEKSP